MLVVCLFICLCHVFTLVSNAHDSRRSFITRVTTSNTIIDNFVSLNCLTWLSLDCGRKPCPEWTHTETGKAYKVHPEILGSTRKLNPDVMISNFRRICFINNIKVKINPDCSFLLFETHHIKIRFSSPGGNMQTPCRKDPEPPGCVVTAKCH